MVCSHLVHHQSKTWGQRLGLQRVLGLDSYETVWTTLHRLCRAMVRPDSDLLAGEVEADEAFLSISDRVNPITPISRKSNTTKTLVAIAVEILQPKGFGRIRIQRIDLSYTSSLNSFIKASIKEGSLIHTDGSHA